MDFLRNAIFTGFLLFVSQGSVRQLFVGTLVALAFFMLQAVTVPFKRPAHNWLNLVELLALLATFQVCLVIHVSESQNPCAALSQSNCAQETEQCEFDSGSCRWSDTIAYDRFLVLTVTAMLIIFVSSTALAVWRSKLLWRRVGTIDASGLLDASSIRQGAAMREQEWQARRVCEENKRGEQVPMGSTALSVSSGDTVESAEAEASRKQASQRRNEIAQERRQMREASVDSEDGRARGGCGAPQPARGGG